MCVKDAVLLSVQVLIQLIHCCVSLKSLMCFLGKIFIFSTVLCTIKKCTKKNTVSHLVNSVDPNIIAADCFNVLIV